MVSQNWWANSLFKGRIGEAIVEAVLSEFGYQVDRTGQEYFHSGESAETSSRGALAPDLSVTEPKTGLITHVEVKARFNRPMSVIMEHKRLEAIKLLYPGTLLVFVSGYNGSVNCANVDEMSSNLFKIRSDGFCEFDLTKGGWRPLWHFFPLVKPGERLDKLWVDLKDSLHSFGERHIRLSEERELFEGERESLIGYIEDLWDPRMKQYIQQDAILDDLNQTQLWNHVREINAYQFALDLHGEENIDTLEFRSTMGKLVGEKGEQNLTLDLRKLQEALSSYPEALRQYEALLSVATALPTGGKWGRTFLEKLQQILPPGVGKAYLGGPDTPLDASLVIDLRTAVALANKRNQLDTAI